MSRAVGLDPAAVAGVRIVVRRVGSGSYEQVTGMQGMADFPGLLYGPWTLSATRALTDDERHALPADAEDVTAFGGGATHTVARGVDTIIVRIRTGRQGTVVISEIFGYIPRTPSGLLYYTGHYIELFNNGFTTEYLDGMLLGLTYNTTQETQSTTCDQAARWRLDSLGIWTQYVYRFPGNGTSYPLAPGVRVIIATDAIDHRAFVPELLDLSGASFEFLGSADVDNPSVPNMISVGGLEWAQALGHGLYVSPIEPKFFIAAPVSLDTLPREVNLAGQEHVRIPRGAILDVVTSRLTPELDASSPSIRCEQIVHPVFDEQPARLHDNTRLQSLARRVASAVVRVIYQRTRNSLADLETAAPSP
ncbi:MAG: DUF4876 domain-containing protein [Gemmatimonadales bacterium]